MSKVRLFSLLISALIMSFVLHADEPSKENTHQAFFK
jgi:hypothetical protein